MTIRGLLDVRASERRNTLAAFATLFAVTTGHTLMETARDAIFLAKMPASRLAWMSLVIVVLALALARVGRRANLHGRGPIAAALVIAAGVTSAFWLAVKSPSPAVLYGLYVWSGLFASWVTVQFWTLLGRVHTLTQAKRLYGIIGAGGVLGAVSGALAARAVMASHSPRMALLAASALFVVAAVPCLAVELPADAKADPGAPSQPAGSMTAGMTLLWDNPFARRVLGIVLVSTLAFTLGDFLFKSLAAQRVPAAELGRFFSTFYAATNTLSLVAQVAIAPFVFRRIGVQRALFVFPALLLFAALGVVGTGGALFAAVALKGTDGALRYSLHRTSTELLLVPVPDGTRERIKPVVDLLGTRGGQAIAAVAILVLAAVMQAGPVVMGILIVTLTGVWIGLVVTIRELYLDVFRETLRSGGLSGKAELPELDLGALETLFAGLNSSRDADVIASLELLAEQHRERLIPALILYHPSRDVVLRALEIFTQMGRTDFVSIADRLNGHPDRQVAASALRARTAVSPDESLLRTRLDDECPQVAVTALVALMAAGFVGSAEAKERLSKVAGASSATVCELARSIRDLGRATDGEHGALFDQWLVRVAAGDVEGATDIAPASALGTKVRLEVIAAMEARKRPLFFPVLVSMLARHELRAAARSAILALPGALAQLDEAMKDPNLSRDVRVHLPRTVSMFGAEDAARVLLPRLREESDGRVRFKVLRALQKLRRREPALVLEEGPIVELFHRTIDHVRELREWGSALAAGGDAPPPSVSMDDPLQAGHHLLLDLVRDKEVHATQRLFFLLELLEREDFDDVWRGLRSRNPKQRASSLELVENLVRPSLRGGVLDLVGEAPRSAPSLSYEDAIVQMLERSGGTMRTLAEYRGAELGISGRASRGPLAPAAIASTLGQRIASRARDILQPVPRVPGGPSRAPA